ncbi:LacI family DNA-binding transcriptional regulator [Demequina sp.]|uniref:LacI family DNA-binding transcriptional regulator n=1 Tax=Demequina sp. TaxID=2050685 RepID=UPI003A88B361
MTVSVKEVAARAGVSVGTVSNVLNRPDSVRQSTIDKVQAAIEELGYVPNDAARQLRAGRSQTLALVVLDVGNPFFTDVARGVEKRAAREGLTVLLANSDESGEREASHLAVFERQRVAGVLLSPVDDDHTRLGELRERGIPVVLVDRGADQSEFPSVSVDDVAGGALAAQHLLDSGRTKLAFVGGPLRIGQVSDRYEGAKHAIAAHDGASLRLVGTDQMTLEEGLRAGAALVALVHEGTIDGVICANDLLAIGVERALLFATEPVRVPEDVALVGYDDISFAATAAVPISSIRQPRDLIGATAVELLLDEGSRPADAPARQVVLAPDLVVRASSAGVVDAAP